jgi:SAM-dependent methyltransferase/glycosyltransferase involved in cell wall biosynthesis
MNREGILKKGIPPGAIAGNEYDLFFFSIVDFSYLFQRPQQLASHFAKRGHRVFYLNITRFVPARSEEDFKIREIKKNLYEVFLKSPEVLRVYDAYLESGTLEILFSSLEALRREWGLITCVSLVHNPYWTPLALKMKDRHYWKIHYDCMDEWDTFKHIGEPLLATEKELVEKADLVTVTAELLLSKWGEARKDCCLVRNACDYEHFNKPVRSDPLAGIKKPIVGFFGGIADWVDIELIEYGATQRRDWSFVLLGGISTDVSAIEKLPNVFLPGNKPYEEMPAYLRRFDVCIIPFKKNKVTEAADPVKLYEYLTSGKPIVARNLNAIRRCRDYVYLFDSGEEFVQSIESALNENDPGMREKRKSLASLNTWDQRTGVMEEEIRKQYKKASIVLVTHNQGPLLETSIENLLAKTDYPNIEVILVENRPREDIRTYLDLLRRRYDWIKFVPSNKKDLAGAYGLGVEISEGEYIVLLSGKTIVTKGWLTKLISYLEKNPDIGVIGPSSIRRPGHARDEASNWKNYGIHNVAYRCPPAKEGSFTEVNALPGSCVAARRTLIVGQPPFSNSPPHHPTFVGALYITPLRGLGGIIAKKAKLKGYRVACAEDVFVHDFRQAASIRRKGTHMLLQIRNMVRRLVGVGSAGIDKAKTSALFKSSRAIDENIQKTKEHWGKESDAWQIGRGIFWLEHELVQVRINEKVTGDPAKTPSQYFKEVMAKWGYTFPLQRCLTLGCGAGFLERELAQYNFCLRHDAFDISDGAIEKAVKAARENNLTHIHYEVRDINKIQLPSETYDAVFGVSSLHHLTALEHIFEEVIKTLKPGGIFFVNEYVGPSRFQWTEKQLEIINAILRILPGKYKRVVTDPTVVKEVEVRPTIEMVRNVDPSEAARSEEILPLLNKYFKVREIKPFGGTILHALLTNITGNFKPDDEEDVRLLKTIFYFEDLLMEQGELPSDFAVIIAEKNIWR